MFLEMTSEWLLGDQDRRHIIIIADADAGDSKQLGDLDRNLATLKFERTVNAPLDQLDRAGMLIIANRHQDLSSGELSAIKAFIARGGGVLAVGVGWSWLKEKAAKGQAPRTLASYPMNRLLGEFGARWNDKKIEGLERQWSGAALEPPAPQIPVEAPVKRDTKQSAFFAKNARSALASGERKEAESLFHQALDYDDRNAAALIGLSDLEFDRGEYQRAADYAKKAVAVTPKNGSYHLRLGDAYFKLLRYSDARTTYQRAKDLGVPEADARLKKLKDLGK